MRTAVLIACIWGALGLAGAAQTTGRAPRPIPANLPETNPYSSPPDLAIGRALYMGRCGHCHGQDGEGGRGAVLTTGRLRRASTDRELFVLIRNGIPDTEMTGTFSLADADIWRMVGHVRELGRQGSSEPSAGDPAAGSLVYQKDGCAACHTIDGQGGFLGPDLSDIGARRAVRHLRQSLLDPNADIPLDYRTVTVTTAAGTSIGGIHLNEDEVLDSPPGCERRSAVFHEGRAGGADVAEAVVDAVVCIALDGGCGEPRGLSRLAATPAEGAVTIRVVVALLSVAATATIGSGSGGAGSHQPADAVVWTFDRLDNIGGHKTTVLGEPRVIDAPVGKAVEFDGVDDALFIDDHPLAGASSFTWEAIFRPDGGQREQRWFHLNEDPATGADTENRMLFEIRVVGDSWFFDAYNQSGTASKALINRAALHPLGAWYHVAAVYDGKEFSNYVDGVREGAAEIHLAPHRRGRASVGVRINRLFYFKGAVHVARFTRRALAPSEFLRPPPKP